MSVDYTRNCEMTADDSRGYWVVTAYGTAGQWVAVSRTLEQATALAGYASMIGESPSPDWTVEDAETKSPYILRYAPADANVADAVAEFLRMENLAEADAMGELMSQAPLCPDAFLAEEDWITLDLFPGTPVYPSRIGQGYYVASDTTGYAYVLRHGTRYVLADGNAVTVLS